MDRVSRRGVAALRLLRLLHSLLIAVSVCLLGPASPGERSASHVEASAQAHAEAAPVPAPGPAEREESTDDPPSAEDDDLAHGPHRGLAILADASARLTRIRGPPAPRSSPLWQPRSSRGPPRPI